MPESSPTFMQPEPQPSMVEQHYGIFDKIRRPISIALLGVVGAGIAGCGGDNVLDSAKPSTTTEAGAGETFPTATATTAAETSTTTTTTTEAEVCTDTWEIKPIERGDSPRWFANGVQAIREAQNAPSEKAREAATEAAHKWFNNVKTDPKILAGALNYFSIGKGMGNMEGVTAADLVDANDPNCASQTATEYAAQFKLFLTDPNVVIKPGVAPANGVNSGANSDGDVVRGEHAGVSGTEEERLALHFSFVREDGVACEVWVMERCGQIVVLEDCIPKYIILLGKTDDDILPGDGTPVAQDPGTPDVPGEGPAGQGPVSGEGYLPGETPPPTPPEVFVPPQATNPQPTTPATTGVQQTAPPASATTNPNNPPNTGTMPPQPPV